MSSTAAAGRILVVDEWLPNPRNDGASLRMVNLLRLLRSMSWAVTLAPERMPVPACSDEPLRHLGVEVETPGRVEQHLRARGADYDVVVLSRPGVAASRFEAARRHAPQAVLVYDTIDLHFVREFRQAKLTGSVRRIERVLELKRQEIGLVRAADRTLVVSSVEKEMLARECQDADIHVVSNIHDAPGTTTGWDVRSGMLFVGNFQHEPNVDAALLLIDEIWPLVRARVPGARLFVVGSNVSPEIRSKGSEDVVVTGQVPDLHPWYEACRVSLAPLRFGAGVKGKVLEHMGHGLPVVGTALAFEGIPARHEHDALIAETPQETADAAARVYSDEGLWQRLSENGPRVVEADFSFDAARRALVNALAPLPSPVPREAEVHA